ncbi:tetratricopeptide repeat protein [Chryseobacterium sp. sg2396]|uniref:tetratricopeptide repeat protein n=1 Tax=Chryseobacterium sp. sg2396 TaxID=3276280 RepID=UPI00367127DF
MKQDLNSLAWKAFEEHDYGTAAKYWVRGYGLPDDETELEKVFQTVNELNEKSLHPDLCAILGLIALDHNEIFEYDREQALIKCIDWSIRGLEKDPQHYTCSRNAGSALYWLNDTKGALQYYLRSDAIYPSPVLQIRIFNIRHQGEAQPDFSELNISWSTHSAMEAYNAGVEINRILEAYPGMPSSEHQRLTHVKIQMYERAYQLYKSAVLTGDGDVLNNDPHTFAMCCNNLAREFNFQGDYHRAIEVTTEGMAYSSFMYILLNRMNGYVHAGMPAEAKADGIMLFDKYMEQMDIFTDMSVADSICTSCIELKQYDEAMEWADYGLEVYYQLDPTDPVMQHEDMTRCITNFFIQKSKTVTALGLEADPAGDSRQADQLLEAMPDNPSLMISRADSFVQEGQWEKAIECYEQAIHFGLQQNRERSVQVALYNKGYIQEVHLHDRAMAFDSFEQSIRHGNRDFWCFYWAVRCAYFLEENEKTICYGSEALSVLPEQENVTDDVIAEIYGHIGAAQIDRERYEDALTNLEKYLQLNPLPHTQNNLKITREYAGKKGGFFRNLLGI